MRKYEPLHKRKKIGAAYLDIEKKKVKPQIEEIQEIKEEAAEEEQKEGTEEIEKAPEAEEKSIEEAVIRCEKCDKEFKFKGALEQHNLAKH